jgi:RNA polymerase sigma-70 factor (ECF subfamily)
MQGRDETWAVAMRAGMAGDRIAYEGLLRDLAAFLRIKIRRGLTNAGLPITEAEDIVQEALIAIHTNRATWRPDAPLMPWVASIARRKMIDAMRRMKRGHVDIDAVSHLFAVEPDQSSLTLRDTLRLADNLSPRQRDVFIAKVIHDRDTPEIAKALGLTNGAVRIALHRSTRQVRVGLLGAS